MPLAAGSRLGTYEIVSPLGAGGMGEVYRARDTKLDRDVAIKILPALFAADPERLIRFEREAKTLAALNHQNIAHVHGAIDQPPALVMEFVEGEDLAQRLQRGPLPIEEALAIARQIATGLEAAHERGIVHRDLKPANIKVRRDGAVKVLDFGLAKVLALDAVAEASGALNSPTITSPATRAGVILGTAVYMSPEQARGADVDVRTDIWAFGAVLFEMISGRQAFDGATTTDVLAAIVRGEPDWRALPVNTPAPLVSLLHRCLRKDRTRRLHSIADARIELEEISLDPKDAADRTSPAFTKATAGRHVVPWAVAALAIAAAVFYATRASNTSAATEPMLHVAIHASPAEMEFFVRWGHTMGLFPDGQTVGFVAFHGGSRRLFLRRLGDFAATPVDGTEHALTVFFSPDGTRVGFITPERILRTVSLRDGTVTVLATGADYRGATWLDDGSIVFSRREGLFQMPAHAGEARQLTTAGPGELHLSPVGVVGSRAVLFANLTATPTRRLEAVSLTDGKRHVVLEQAAGPLVLPENRLLFTRDNGVYVTAFAAATLTVAGTPIKIAEDIVVRGDGSALIDVARNGSMVYVPRETILSELQWVPRAGSESTVSERRMAYGNPRLSADGRRVAFEDLEGAVWVQDLERSALIKVSEGASFQNSFPAWASNSRLVYKTAYDLRIVDLEALGPGKVIPGSGPQDFPCDVTPDGKLAFVRNETKQSGDLLMMSLDGGAAETLVSTPAYDGGLSFSPDARWFAYSSSESGRSEIYVGRLGSAGKRQISANGGTQPLWARNGEIFYRSGRKMFSVRVRLEAQPVLSPPQLVFDRPFAFGSNVSIPNYAVSADGQRLLMVRTVTDSIRLHMITNWTRELARKMADAR